MGAAVKKLLRNISDQFLRKYANFSVKLSSIMEMSLFRDNL